MICSYLVALRTETDLFDDAPMNTYFKDFVYLCITTRTMPQPEQLDRTEALLIPSMFFRYRWLTDLAVGDMN
jgi:hypothetical protein